MRFPERERLALPVTFERYLPGALHADGRRYLPRLIFRLADGTRLSVVDRHHYVEPSLVGRRGSARLVFLLATVHLQTAGTQRRGLAADASDLAQMPDAFGQVLAVPSFELRRGHLPYEELFTEFVLDIGLGTIGVRTSMTAPRMAQALGAERLQPGDWVQVARPRIDVLEFTPQAQPWAQVEASR